MILIYLLALVNDEASICLNSLVRSACSVRAGFYFFSLCVSGIECLLGSGRSGIYERLVISTSVMLISPETPFDQIASNYGVPLV